MRTLYEHCAISGETQFSVLLQRTGTCTHIVINCLILYMLGNFSDFCCYLLFFSKLTFSKNYFRNTIRASNGMEPDQDQMICKGYQQTTKVVTSKEIKANVQFCKKGFIHIEYLNPQSANHDCSRRQILQHLS